VHLQGEDGGIELEVSDRGVGFDVSDAKNNRGLGLVNMAERIHQVNGMFSLDSRLNVGTRDTRACAACFALRYRIIASSPGHYF